MEVFHISNFLFSFSRYADLYFNAEEFDKAVDDLSNDAVYDEVLLNGGVNNENPVPVLQAVPPQPDPQQDSFTKRRYNLPPPLICLIFLRNKWKSQAAAEALRVLLYIH